MAKKKGMGTATWIIMLLLVLGLGGFGVTQFGQNVATVATVGDVEITGRDYARAVQSQLEAFQRETGQQISFQQGRALGIDGAALGTLVADAGLEHETARIGLSAGDRNVSDEIRGVSGFQGLDGSFDRETYELALRQNDVSVGEFEDQVRTDLAEGLVRRAIGAGLTTPDIYVDTLYNHARETRDVTWARLTAEDLDAPVAEPTDEDLAAFHEENIADFTRPETKVIRYAWVTPDMLAENVTVDEEQVRKLYDDRIEEFDRPERRLVERLVFATEAEAQSAMDRIEAGETGFDDLVEERGLDLADVDYGDVSADQLGAAADEVFALTEPGIVGPLPSDLGPAIYRMNGILPAEQVSFEEAEEDLRTEAAQDRARRIILDLVPQVEDLLAGGADAGVLAERTEMEEGRIEWNRDVSDGVAAYDGFRRAAAQAGQGDFAEVIELDDGGILTLSVEEVREPAPIPLDEVRDAVTEAWSRDATEKALTEQAEAIADQLREGREMAGLGLTLRTNRGMTRDAFIEETPPEFTRTVFGLDPDGVAVLSADGHAWLVRLDAVVAADASTPEAQSVRARFANETAQSYSNALTQAVTRALVERAGVEINSSAIAGINAQLQ